MLKVNRGMAMPTIPRQHWHLLWILARLWTQHLAGYFPDYLMQPKPHCAPLPPHTPHVHPHNSPTLSRSLVSHGHNWLAVAWLRRCLTCSCVPHSNDESFSGNKEGRQALFSMQDSCAVGWRPPAWFSHRVRLTDEGRTSRRDKASGQVRTYTQESGKL